MEAQTLAPLTTLSTTLPLLLDSLTSLPTLPQSTTHTTSLLTADSALTSSLELLHTHQRNHARILHLRARAAELNEQLRGMVGECQTLRQEIGVINPSILEGESDEDEEDGDYAEGKVQDVDAETLLAFARRIGKHNAAAQREAEREAERRLVEAREAMQSAQPQQNGDNREPTLPENERVWLDEPGSTVRVVAGMPFPAAEKLRMGMLGRLQWVREREGETGVERALVGLGVSSGVGGMGAEEKVQQEDVEMADQAKDLVHVVPAVATQEGGTGARPRPPQPERKKSVGQLRLDMWTEEDEDDEDGEEDD